MRSDMRLFKRGQYWYVEFARSKKKSLGVTNRNEAEPIFNELKKLALKGRLRQLDTEKRIVLGVFKKEFFKRHTDIDDDTVKAYDLAFRLFIDSTGGSTLLSRIDDSDIDKFKNDCLARKCKKVSINTYLRHLRGILNKAHAWGYINQKVPITVFKIGKRHPVILTRKQITKILIYARKHEPEMWRIIRFALWTGARREEIKSLKWQNIYKTVARLIGKGDKERTVPLLPAAIKAMGSRQDVGPVFVQWSLCTYTHKFKKIVRTCGIKNVSFHKMRHTAATQMLANGISLHIVQEIMGHADIKTTRIYTKILQKNLVEEMKKFRY